MYIFSELTGQSFFALWVRRWAIGISDKISLNVSRGLIIKCFAFSWSNENYALSRDTRHKIPQFHLSKLDLSIKLSYKQIR